MPKGVRRGNVKQYDWLTDQVQFRPTDEGCWIWPFGVNDAGYPKIKIEGKTTYAHIAALTMVEPKPEGMEACHTCPGGTDNPACVNPDHLKWDTHEANIQRKHELGYKVWNRAFTDDEVCYIRSRLSEGATAPVIAGEVGCEVWPIYDIKSGRSYKDVV